MRGVGSYMFVPKLRELELSELWWYYDVLSQCWVVKNGPWGQWLSYITREMVETTVFTPESMLSNWIWRVSERCRGDLKLEEPLLVAR